MPSTIVGTLLALTILTACSDDDTGAATEGNETLKLEDVRESRECADKPTVYCGNLGMLDCGAAVDGPLYYFDANSLEIISTCGGACFAPDAQQLEVCRTLCPPPEWTCGF